MSKTEKQKQAKPWMHFMAGGVGGTIGAVITCPLEVVKTRLQARQSSQSLMQILQTIHRNEGIRGLWRGLGPNLVGVVPARAIYFSTYATTKSYLIDSMTFSGSSSSATTTSGQKESPAVHLISAVCAGLATSTFTNPIWLIKTRMQLQDNSIKQRPSAVISPAACSVPASVSNTSSSSVNSRAVKRVAASASMSTSSTMAAAPPPIIYKNSLDCLRQVVRHEGPLALFRGLSASYLGILEGTMQWVAYEQFKSILADNRAISTTAASSSDISSAAIKPKFSIADTFLAAGLAKFIAAITTYPHEVLRTRLRQAVSVSTVVEGRQVIQSRPKYAGIAHVFRTVLKEEGVFAFYGGLTAHILRTVPNAAIMFLCYESLIFLIDQGQDGDL